MTMGQEMNVRKAIVLAAGMGGRLYPFTSAYPKPLVPIRGVPILQNSLHNLAACGIAECVIIVGYRKDAIIDSIGDVYCGMHITYVVSDRYQTADNIYSLWLAREHFDQDILLLEGDVFFERQLLKILMEESTSSAAAVAPYQSYMSGTVVEIDDDGTIKRMVEGKEQGVDFDYRDKFKTVDIYLLREHFLQRYFLPELERIVQAGTVRNHYDLALRNILEDTPGTLRAINCGNSRWYEIDDDNDRRAAEYIFSTPEEQYQFLATQHGGYWRYDFVDHALLYNVHFPPDEMLVYLQHNLRDLVMHYPVGHHALADLAATVLEQPAEYIVVGNGASELIRILLGRLGQRVIVPTPSFNEYENTLAADRLVRFPLLAPSFHLNVDAFAQVAIDARANLAIVISPNNPTSLAVPRGDLLRLCERLMTNGCTLLLDESFVDFTPAGHAHSLENELDHFPNLIILKSMSKIYGIGGLRLGYVLTSNRDLADAVRAELPIWNINGLAEAFLRMLPRYMRAFATSCDLVRQNRDQLYRDLSQIPGLVVYKPDANYVFARLPDLGPSGPEVIQRLFIEHRILAKHCQGKTMSDGERYIRVSSRSLNDNTTLVQALRDILYYAKHV